jgi:SPP1 family predicted phage head-tail adaptor
VWAKKKDLPGRDVELAGRLVYAQRTVFIVDYRTDLTTENRVYYNSKVYEIISLTEYEDARERYLEVMTNLLDTEVWT